MVMRDDVMRRHEAVMTTMTRYIGMQRDGQWPATRRRNRIVGGLIACAAAAVLFVASLVTPSPDGLGTHTQLNLPACGWISTMDLPCMTCGMTTAYAHAADGQFLASFRTQPMGCVLALLTAMALIGGAYVAVTGCDVGWLARRAVGRRLWWSLGLAFALAWGYKILAHKGLV